VWYRRILTLAACGLALLSAAPAHATPGQPEAADEASDAWSASLSAVGGDDVNVAWTGGALRLADQALVPGGQRAPVAQGMLLTAPHALVANPAGIDLADGVFWDGLQLTTNAWVDVAYLWTGSGPRGVVGSGPLNIRAGAGSGFASKGYAATRAQVPIECWVTGQSVAGPYRTTTRWNRVGAGQYVSHAYISATSGGAAPAC
jgi:hypothetical protein